MKTTVIQVVKIHGFFCSNLSSDTAVNNVNTTVVIIHGSKDSKLHATISVLPSLVLLMLTAHAVANGLEVCHRDRRCKRPTF